MLPIQLITQEQNISLLSKALTIVLSQEEGYPKDNEKTPPPTTIPNTTPSISRREDDTCSRLHRHPPQMAIQPI